MKLAAPAKLNLYLHVIGRRPDGYHLLDSLVAFADVYDVLTITQARSLSFSAGGPFAAAMGDYSAANLVVRAALALAAATGRAPDMAIHLTKNLPVASGIGGGSADAAACLRGLARHWQIDAAAPVLREVAASLGSDIPACVEGRACYLGGVGTELSPAPKLPPAGLLLVNPGIALPTPAVYRGRQGAFSLPARFADPPGDARSLAALLAGRTNDLASPAIMLVPEIAMVIDVIGATACCLLARMSGSGATCFGLFPDAAAAAQAGTAIGQSHPDWWVAPGRLIEDTGLLELP